MPKKIIIVGAGLSGTLLAIRLAQKGLQVSLYEKRSDMRKDGRVEGRSINLALSDRGLKALKMIGMDEEIQKDCIPMKGRKIHPVSGEPFVSPYSGRADKYINSISRGGLNISLLNKAEQFSNLELCFDKACLGIDYHGPIAQFQDKQGQKFEVEADFIFGADGSNSVVRKSMLALSHHLLFSYSQEYLGHAYKELVIPPAVNGGFRLDNNALHIWPRGGYMMIALPNLDESFTVTLFLPHKGPNSFEKLDNASKLIQFFKENFPDALTHMPSLVDDFFSNPTGLLLTVKCLPWQVNGKSLLLGDAAHAIVPFYGQGMNASFEDVVVFDELLEKNQGNWEATINEYESVRKKDTDAIADLAIDNFYEMRDQVANEIFQRKRKLEMKLEQTFEDYMSKYSMVTFNENIRYSEAMIKGRRQDELLLEYCKEHTQMEDVKLEEALEYINTNSRKINLK
ncbi:MAG: FAD-dependent monooxygenase [Bacteroidetes bacterium]|nr:FAD-dependent monooxygenase [Bacteroidota bacterium]